MAIKSQRSQHRPPRPLRKDHPTRRHHRAGVLGIVRQAYERLSPSSLSPFFSPHRIIGHCPLLPS